MGKIPKLDWRSKMMKVAKVLIIGTLILCMPMAYAVEKPTENQTDKSLLDYLTDVNGQYIGPTVEDQVVTMDTDHNGFADVFEVRAYLESKHGKGYEKNLLDKLVQTANRKSCGTSITNELSENFYTEK